MAKLDWLVVTDWFFTETADFWRAPDMKPEEVKTECYFLPAALIYEKTGSINNSGRWIQWREKAVEPPGEAKPDFDQLLLLWREIRALYEKEGGACPDQILKTNMDYTIDGKPDIRALCWAMNGYDVKTRKLLPSYGSLQADGSTACGIWIFSGYYNNEANKMDPMKQPMTRRSKDDRPDSVCSRSGRLRGPPTAAFFTTVLRPTKTANHGTQNACSSNGRTASGCKTTWATL